MCILPSSYRYGCPLWVPLGCQYGKCVWHGIQGLPCSPPEANVGHLIGRMSPETLLKKGK